MRAAVPLVLGLVLAAACGTADSRVTVAAGTTIVDSGFIERVIGDYEQATGVDVAVVAGSSAQVLELLAQGSAGLAISHAPTLERAFLRDHPEARSAGLVASEFLVLGPADLVTALGRTDVLSAFRAVWESERWPFVTRDDGSGTYTREREVWAAAGVTPSGDRYVRTGQGMGFTLQVADQRGAATIAEVGAFLAARDNLSLRVVDLEASPLLDNPYVGTAVRGTPGEELLDWLRSDAGLRAISEANDALFGEPIYTP